MKKSLMFDENCDSDDNGELDETLAEEDSNTDLIKTSMGMLDV